MGGKGKTEEEDRKGEGFFSEGTTSYRGRVTAGEKRGEEGGFFFSWLEETLKAIGGKTQVSFLQAMDFLMFRVLYDVLWVL